MRIFFASLALLGLSGLALAQPTATLRLEELSGRRAFLRAEPNAVVRLNLYNLVGATPDLHVEAQSEGVTWKKDEPTFSANGKLELSIPLPTSQLRAGNYSLTIKATAQNSAPVEETISYSIANRALPGRMNVFLWGDMPPGGLKQLEELGFTQAFAVWVNQPAIWQAHRPLVPGQGAAASARITGLLDEALTRQMELGINLWPGRFVEDQDDLVRVGRDGKPLEKRGAVAFLPPMRSYFADVARSAAGTYGAYPAWTFANLNSEIRDHAEPSFRPAELADFKAWGGGEVPALVQEKWGVSPDQVPLPADGIVADDDPILRYYQWYWTRGDGWPVANAFLSDELKNALPQNRATPFFTFTDPALRVASLYGSGAGLDAIEHWTYTNPDPFRVGITADELARMAAGSKQQAIQMTQLFWYRSQTAPNASEAAPTGATGTFADYDPNAQYLTISPDALREAFWTMLSRPTATLAYHGWQALLPSDGTHAYKYTNPKTQVEFKTLHTEVLEPIGSTLRKIPDRASDVGFLESFASQVFARRGNYGWANKTQGARYRQLLYANLQPEVIYEQTVTAQSLDNYKVLCLFETDVLPRGVFEKIAAWQKRGGLLVADQHLAKALKADIVLPDLELFPENNARDKASVQAAATQLLGELKGKYAPHASSSDSDVLLHARESDGVEYLFAVNDKRAYGDYVGQFGRMMENGVPAHSQISVARPARFVYDLRAGLVSSKIENGKTQFAANLEAAGGQIFVLTDQKISALKLNAPATAKRGGVLDVSAQLLDGDGKPMRGVWPLQIEVLDPQNRLAENSGWYGAVAGAQTVKIELASNDLPGAWKVRARDLAGKLSGEKVVNVQ